MQAAQGMAEHKEDDRRHRRPKKNRRWQGREVDLGLQSGLGRGD
jgi:hypothetical protein